MFGFDKKGWGGGGGSIHVHAYTDAYTPVNYYCSLISFYHLIYNLIMMGLIRKLTSTISLHMSTLAFSKQITYSTHT